MSYMPINAIDHGGLVGLADDDHPQYVKDAGDTMTGSLVVDTATSHLTARGAAATNRDINFNTGATGRWHLRTDSTAEGGANAGSDFNIIPRDDAGIAQVSALTIIRSTGLATVKANPTAALGIATKQYIDKDVAGARRALTSPGISIPSGASTAVTGWVPDTLYSSSSDTGNTGVITYDGAGLCTLREAGVYSISGNVLWAANATGRRSIRFLVNGNIEWGQSLAPNAAAQPHYQNLAVAAFYFPINTTITFAAYQDSGAAVAVSSCRWELRRVALS